MRIQKASEIGDGEIVSEDVFRALAQQTDRLFLVCMLLRPGVATFTTRLEFEHFPPLTAANAELDLYTVEWSDLPWAVISIPKTKRHLAEEVAEQCGLRIADGIPWVIGGDGDQHFPLHGPNVFTMENVRESKVYDGIQQAEEMKQDDIEQAKAIAAAHEAPIADVIKALKQICK